MFVCPTYSWDLLCAVPWHGGDVAGRRIVKLFLLSRLCNTIYEQNAPRTINMLTKIVVKKGAEARLSIWIHLDSHKWQLQITNQSRTMPASSVSGSTERFLSRKGHSCKCKTALATVSRAWKGERIVDYSSRIIGLVGELQCVCRDDSDLETNIVLLRSLAKEDNVTVEYAMASLNTYTEAFSRLIGWETRVRGKEKITPKALITTNRDSPKCFVCSKPGYFAKKCKNKKWEFNRGESGEEKQSCFKCKRVWYLMKDCPETRGNPCEIQNVTVLVLTAIPLALIKYQEIQHPSIGW